MMLTEIHGDAISIGEEVRHAAKVNTYRFVPGVAAPEQSLPYLDILCR